MASEDRDLFALVVELLGYRRKVFRDLVAPGKAEQFSLMLAALGAASIAVAAILKVLEKPHTTFVLLGMLLVPVSSLLYLLSGAVRNVRLIWNGVSEPAQDLDASFRMFKACVLAVRAWSEGEIRVALAFVIHQQTTVRSRSGFLAGAVDHIGVLPLAVAAWWAWRVAGGPTDFSVWEMGGLGFVAGVHFGLLLVRSRLDMLARIQCVFEQALASPDFFAASQAAAPPKSIESNKS